MGTSEELLGTRTSSAIDKDGERLVALHLYYWDESQLYSPHFIGVYPVESLSQ